MTAKVLLVDDHKIVREGLRAIRESRWRKSAIFGRVRAEK